jgi:hypothetical protein
VVLSATTATGWVPAHVQPSPPSMARRPFPWHMSDRHLPTSTWARPSGTGQVVCASSSGRRLIRLHLRFYTGPDMCSWTNGRYKFEIASLSQPLIGLRPTWSVNTRRYLYRAKANKCQSPMLLQEHGKPSNHSCMSSVQNRLLKPCWLLTGGHQFWPPPQVQVAVASMLRLPRRSPGPW